MWAEATKELYGNESQLDYIDDLESPIQDFYPTRESKQNEMLRTLVEVNYCLINNL